VALVVLTQAVQSTEIETYGIALTVLGALVGVIVITIAAAKTWNYLSHGRGWGDVPAFATTGFVVVLLFSGGWLPVLVFWGGRWLFKMASRRVALHARPTSR